MYWQARALLVQPTLIINKVLITYQKKKIVVFMPKSSARGIRQRWR